MLSIVPLQVSDKGFWAEAQCVWPSSACLHHTDCGTRKDAAEAADGIDRPQPTNRRYRKNKVSQEESETVESTLVFCESVFYFAQRVEFFTWTVTCLNAFVILAIQMCNSSFFPRTVLTPNESDWEICLKFCDHMRSRGQKRGNMWLECLTNRGQKKIPQKVEYWNRIVVGIPYNLNHSA